VYVRDGLVASLTPHAVGWMSVRDSDDYSRMCDYDLTYRDDARRFEVVTLPYQDFAGAEREPRAALRARRRGGRRARGLARRPHRGLGATATTCAS
jgi:selenocysteine lyase/cysteine desulfurase